MFRLFVTTIPLTRNNRDVNTGLVHTNGTVHPGVMVGRLPGHGVVVFPPSMQFSYCKLQSATAMRWSSIAWSKHATLFW